MKGLNVVSSGDFTHPKWFSELEEGLEEVETGLYRIKKNAIHEQGFKSFLPQIHFNLKELQEIRFFISTEISCIFSQGGKVRRVHLLLFVPSLPVAKKINEALVKAGAKLASDGRPIIGMSASRLLDLALSVDKDCMIVPAHAWTPWFAVFGSKSGFDSLEECFEELTPNIYAIETGLSSDPPMNWRVSGLDDITLISNSDAHSPQNLAREANVFELETLSYNAICKAIKEKKLYTIEFYPEEGKYHFDGHMVCGVSFSPIETKKNKEICPKCKKSLTIGVLNRVEELADRDVGVAHVRPMNSSNFSHVSLVGLDDVIAESIGSRGRKTKKVLEQYQRLIQNFGNEFNILLFEDIKNISEKTFPEIVEGIRRNRVGKVSIKPGYDGKYGEVTIFSPEEQKQFQQARLF